ncbi:uracil phosphoribosyltransferase [Olsenella uli DSM 7084]|uniref:Uracil phosphoribosyltransferase n=1 Tax=Olsenella uli (strain ATCC 49627 / DSM 7084 / CCUG 31166 / CIP 109912 / JCM 12494 / LMG 11480 / NCIMB 702895 / VPI D76D-27C) TaxID=633147 RepID=E1QXZ1_OLSUV|nr:uracil phosphoribosyltransferase [Olsenella uli]ADK67255.1 uracil phosphoribosyltransferase [Olsenella uli DSM 7084]EUB30792.1 uracil phosphoribosyltransferase [Olsenella uli MSTE5]KRO12478.1 uracil phosphoribosyltransferase [Olsenella uli DSM 7084]MBS6418540.1 uracil phosphoribosyltransferase [Olsenella uli]
MEFDEKRLTVIDHPLVQHKLHILRDKSTGTKQFRELVTELAIFEGYEAMRDFPLEDVEVETPLERTVCKKISGKKVAIIPILRAGLGMVEGILELVPSARVGHVGMYRDPTTHEPHQYYCKFPDDIENRICLIVDPMLATGGSLTAAIQFLREAGVKDVRALTLVSAPEGVKTVLDFDSEVRLYTCALDRQLNESAYILPGLGDAGDRIYGTK